MSPAGTPGETSGSPGGARRSTSGRIAFGTLARSTGEAVGKLASLAFFVVVARELGEEQFGDLVFGMALSTVLLLVAGLGMQELIAREVAKNADNADHLLWNVVVLKAVMMVALLAVIVAVVAVQDRSLESGAAIVIVSVGIGFEYQAGTLYAVFDGRERQELVATTLIVNRTATAAMGIVAAVAGAGLVTIAVLFTAGSALGVLTAYVLMRGYVIRPRREVHPGGWRGLIRTSLPLGIVTLLGTLSFRTSVGLLGLIAAGSAAVGEYGAAFRLIESTLFVAASFNVAILPWFSRRTATESGSMAQAFELSLKGVITVMLPVGLALSLFAEPLIEALYGAEYDEAVVPLRVLGALTVLWGLNTTIITVLISRDRPATYTLPALVALVPGLTLSIILMHAHGAVGAATAAVVWAALLACLTIPATARLLGGISIARMAAAPVAAGAAMAVAAAALTAVPWVPAVVLSLAAYCLVFLTVERLFFPRDLVVYAGALRGGTRLSSGG